VSIDVYRLSLLLGMLTENLAKRHKKNWVIMQPKAVSIGNRQKLHLTANKSRTKAWAETRFESRDSRLDWKPNPKAGL